MESYKIYKVLKLQYRFHYIKLIGKYNLSLNANKTILNKKVSLVNYPKILFYYLKVV